MPFKIQRQQFPVGLVFALTINKPQGQTMQIAGLYLKAPVFSHGVKLFSERFGKGNGLGAENEDMGALRHQRMELEHQLVEIEKTMMCLWKSQEEYYMLRDWNSRVTLPKAVMSDLVTAEAYEMKVVRVDKIKEIYFQSGGV
ncbi:hypothetical protein BGZ82_002928, partial [Podila clonocystis]